MATIILDSADLDKVMEVLHDHAYLKLTSTGLLVEWLDKHLDLKAEIAKWGANDTVVRESIIDTWARDIAKRSWPETTAEWQTFITLYPEGLKPVWYAVLDQERWNEAVKDVPPYVPPMALSPSARKIEN